MLRKLRFLMCVFFAKKPWNEAPHSIHLLYFMQPQKNHPYGKFKMAKPQHYTIKNSLYYFSTAFHTFSARNKENVRNRASITTTVFLFCNFTNYNCVIFCLSVSVCMCVAENKTRRKRYTDRQTVEWCKKEE